MMDRFIRSVYEPLSGSEINAGTDRRAMGYPDHYAPTRFEAPAAVYRRLLGLSPVELARRLEDPGQALDERLAAGGLLALVGDPRIDALNPAMVTIPGGRVVLGLESDQAAVVAASLAEVGVLPEWIEKECPCYEVVLRPFRIGKYPVVNQEYLAFLKDERSAELPTSWEFGRYPHERANHPVYTVSEQAADSYAAWLSARTGRRFRLPTEAEWEYAAAGPTAWSFPGAPSSTRRAPTRSKPVCCPRPRSALSRGATARLVCATWRGMSRSTWPTTTRRIRERQRGLRTISPGRGADIAWPAAAALPAIAT